MLSGFFSNGRLLLAASVLLAVPHPSSADDEAGTNPIVASCSEDLQKLRARQELPHLSPSGQLASLASERARQLLSPRSASRPLSWLTEGEIDTSETELHEWVFEIASETSRCDWARAHRLAAFLEAEDLTGYGLGHAVSDKRREIVVAIFTQPASDAFNLVDLARKFETAVNRERVSRNLIPLRSNEVLRQVATGHAEDMAENEYISHTSPSGTTPADRVRARGIPFHLVAENIGEYLGVDDPVRVIVQGWIDSPGHFENLTRSDVRTTGIGVAVGEDDRLYVVQLFIAPK